MVDHRAFRIVIVLLVLLSCAVAASRSPLSSAEVGVALLVLDWVLFAAFALEWVVRVVADGLVLHRGAFLRSPWNCIDTAALIVYLVPVYASPASRVAAALASIRAVRLVTRVHGLRVRALRARARACAFLTESVKMAVYALVVSFSSLASVILLLGVIFAAFAVGGLALFGGAMHACSDTGALRVHACQ